MGIYYFARPNQMIDHKFTDDVAITLVWTQKKAINTFDKLYIDIQPTEVKRIKLKSIIKRCWVLTDY